jgi:hypothetical protein
MKRITAHEFKEAVWADPAWASKLTEPTEVTGWCLLEDLQISHLSPLLHFTHPGTTIAGCKNLKVAEGNFHSANFENSGIEEIGELVIKGKLPTGLLCDLTGTPILKKNPMKAAEAMTGSKDVKVWEIIRDIAKTSAWIKTCGTLTMGINRWKKQATLKALKKKGSLEI